MNMKDIAYTTCALERFIKRYKKLVALKDYDQIENVRKLDEITRLLKQKRFDIVLKDVVIEHPTTTNFSEEELIAWNTFFNQNN